MKTPDTLKNRMIHVTLEHTTIFNIINIYAPANDTEKDAFYNSLTNYLRTVNNTDTILGDFNTVDSELDIPNGLTALDQRKQYMRSIYNMDYIDTYRYYHPREREYTYQSMELRIYIRRLLNSL